MREEFEAWLLREHGLESEWQDERNCFKDYPAHLAFKAWQASRAALRVELPGAFPSNPGTSEKVMWEDSVIAALQQAGIEVKQ
ncbi:hypothetical protein F3H16_27730 [Pseudomonas aeruginosa]|nr:hypothetical protein F3H15_33015 [Pseudomonas aeruginosa]KAA5636916.1 hypothetical protein F3H16_27730 [Pseudomonas aeruginosa]KAA5667949.1 hypothetical protein F3G64_10010 [Pseudomonas aeruginosa]